MAAKKKSKKAAKPVNLDAPANQAPWLREELLFIAKALERRLLQHRPVNARDPFGSPLAFNMSIWNDTEVQHAECGTICCIGGATEVFARRDLRGGYCNSRRGLKDLFYPFDTRAERPWSTITPDEAAKAIRNYLRYGRPRWKSVLGLS